MPIKPENEALIAATRDTAKGALLKLSGEKPEYLFKLTQKTRQNRQFLVGLSIATLGITVPQLFSLDLPAPIVDLLFVSLGMFTFTAIVGLLSLIPVALKELHDIPELLDHHTDELQKDIKEIDEIKRMVSDQEAGRRFQMLQNKSRLMPMRNLTIIEVLGLKYIDSVLLGMFLNALFLMVFALIKYQILSGYLF